MSYTERLSQSLAVVATIDPQSATAGTYLTDAVDMLQFRRAFFILSVGALTASNTSDFTVTGCSTSGGTYALVTGKTATQLTKAGSDDNKQVIIEVTAEEAAAQGFRFLKGQLITATAAALASVVVLAGQARYGAASDNDLASVDEIIA